jgi:hypothetical protein
LISAIATSSLPPISSFLLLALVLLVACSARPEAATLPTPRSQRLLAFNDTILRGYNASDSLAVALGLAPLRRIQLPEGDAEIRIWSGAAMGVPYRMVRLVRTGTEVSGIVAWHWPVDNAALARSRPWVPIDSIMRHNHEGRCEEFRRHGTAEGCIARLRQVPQWRTIWDSLTSLGIWEQPDQSELPNDGRMITDGWSMTVELRDGDRYRSFAYINPDAHDHPAQRRAALMPRATDAAWAAASFPPSRLRSYRGRLELGYQQVPTFIACGSTARWGLEGNLLRLPRFPEGADSAGVVLHFVEIKAVPAPPGIAQMRRSPYEEILSVREVDSVKAWTTESCESSGRQ